MSLSSVVFSTYNPYYLYILYNSIVPSSSSRGQGGSNDVSLSSVVFSTYNPYYLYILYNSIVPSSSSRGQGVSNDVSLSSVFKHSRVHSFMIPSRTGI